MAMAVDSISDPLAGCLHQLTMYFNCKTDLVSLLASMPLSDGRLLPEIFPRAAEKAGLDARLCQQKLSRLSDQQLPAVILLENDDAVILLRQNKVEQQAHILTSDGEQKTLTIRELDKKSSDYIISVSAQPLTGFNTLREPASTGKYRWFWSVLGRFWRTYRDVLLASFLVNLFALATPLFVMNVYDRVVPNQAYETLWLLAVGVFMAFCFDFVIKMVRARYVDLVGRQIDITLSAQLLEKVLGLQLKSRPVATGSFMNSLSEFESIRNFINSATVLSLVDLPFVILFLGIIYWIAPVLVIIPLTCMVVAGLTAVIVNGPLQRTIQESQQVSSERQSFLMETLIGLTAVKTSCAESDRQYRWERMIQYLAESGLKVRRLQFISSQTATFTLQMGTIFLVIIGVYLIGLGELSMGGLIATMMISGRCTAPVVQSIGLLNSWQRAKQALDLSSDIMSLPQEREAGRGFLMPPTVKGDWKIQGLSFAYPDAPPLLKNISITISAGSKVAMLGRMGSGKSTLLQLMMGLWEQQEGSVSLDGIDIRQLDPLFLRLQIGYVPQRIDLFQGTVRDNIVMGASGISDDAVISAVQRAGLTDFLSSHQDGLNHSVGENGRNLSGGQIQSLAIARALLSNPKILLLDEPSSSMDAQTETHFCKTLKALKDCTIILVTHKATLLDVVDEVIALEKGQVTAQGNPRDLIQARSYQARKQGVAQ